MKTTLARLGLGLAGAAIAAALVGALVFSPHHRPALEGIGTASSVVVATPTDTPPDPSPSSAPPAVVASPTPTQVATVVNPLPPAAPTAAPAPTTAPVQTQPSPTPPPPPPPALPSPSPTPPPPVCSWSIDVLTLTNSGWTTLGTWASQGTGTSPIFITAGTGWLRYTYQFTAACVGTVTLASSNAFNGAAIYSDPITSTGSTTREANLGPNTQVLLTVR